MFVARSCFPFPKTAVPISTAPLRNAISVSRWEIIFSASLFNFEKADKPFISSSDKKAMSGFNSRITVRTASVDGGTR